MDESSVEDAPRPSTSELWASKAEEEFEWGTVTTPSLSMPEDDETLESGSEAVVAGPSFEAELRKHYQAEVEARIARQRQTEARATAVIDELRRELTAERSRAKSAEAALERSRAALSERREVIEAGFRDGLAAAEGGVDVALRPEEELTLRELAAKRTAEAGRRGFELLADARRELVESEKTKKECLAKVAAAQFDVSRRDEALGRADKQHGELRSEIGRLEARVENMKRVDAAQREALAEAAEDRSVLTALKSQINKYERDADEARAASKQAAAALERASRTEADCAQRVADAEKFMRLATMDADQAKASLGSETRRADERERRALSAERDLAAAREEIIDLRNRLGKAADDYDARLAAKVAVVTEAARRDVESLRQQRQDFDRAELEALREARRDVVAQLEREGERRAALERDLDAARRERDDAEARRLASAADLTADHKVLSYELATARTSLDQMTTEKNDSHNRASMLRDQLDVAEREHAALEARSAAGERALRNEIAGLAAKVSAYEQLEIELDAAVLRCAADDANPAETRLLGSLPGTSSALAAGLSRPERRVKHAVLLAQKLIKTEAEAHDLDRRLDRASASEAALQAALARAHSRLADASKPAKHLLVALQQRDDDINDLRRKLNDARAAAAHAADQAQKAAQHNDDLEAQVHRLLKHRAELSQLKRLLAQLRSDPNALPPLPGGVPHPAATSFAPPQPRAFIGGTPPPTGFAPPFIAPYPQQPPPRVPLTVHTTPRRDPAAASADGEGPAWHARQPQPV